MSISVETWELSRIKPYEHNAKKHPKKQIEALAKQIEAHGFDVPIVVDKDGVVIKGHGRLLALKHLKQPTAQVIVRADLTEAQVKAARIADNKLAEGEIDADLLKVDLDWLDAMDFDLGLAGFEPEPTKGNSGSDADDVPDVPQNLHNVARGQIWQLGVHRLMCGDTTNLVDMGLLLSGKLAALVVTDPPYNVAYTGKTKEALKIQNDAMGNSEFREFLYKSFYALKEHTQPGGGIYVFHADLEGYNFRGALTDSGWLIKQCCIWVKNVLVMGRQDYQWQHEPVLYGWKGGASHKWFSDRKQTTVWEFNKPSRNAEHPTMKPVDLIEYPIRNSSEEGMIVLDGFGGSGSTLIACEKSGRVSYNMELDPHYCSVIIERWQQFTGQKAVLLSS